MSETGGQNELEKARVVINEVDAEISKLFEKRMHGSLTLYNFHIFLISSNGKA